MSPSSIPEGSPDTVPVSITSDAPIEIFVIDHRFELVKRDIARVDVNLKPGVYKVKFRAGNVTRERMLTVEPGVPQSITAPAMPIATAAPLETSALTHEYHLAAAAQESRNVHVTRGAGAQIFVMMRQWSHADRRRTSTRDPSDGVTLHALDGTTIATFSVDGVRNLGEQDPWAACNIDLAPGCYRLRMRNRRRDFIEQLVVASPGWQTQVFLLDYVSSRRSLEHVDDDAVPGPLASVLLARIGEGFVTNSRDLHLAELARLNLAYGRDSDCIRGVVQEMLGMKTESPMLGIYSAYALLTESPRDAGKLLHVVGKCRSLLGEHPDLDAIEMEAGLGAWNVATDRAFTVPPTIARGWHYVVQRSLERPSLVPEGSFAARMSTRLWGNGPWTMWEYESDLDQPAIGEQDTLVQDLSTIARIAIKYGIERSRERSQPLWPLLNDFEASILSDTADYKIDTRPSGASTPVAAEAAEEAAAEPGNVDYIIKSPLMENAPAFEKLQHIARSLNVPPAAAQKILSSAAAKLRDFE